MTTRPAKGKRVRDVPDELRQCLQIIMSNAGNIADSDTSVANHSAARIIESTVYRATKAVELLERAKGGGK